MSGLKVTPKDSLTGLQSILGGHKPAHYFPVNLNRNGSNNMANKIIYLTIWQIKTFKYF